MMKRIGKKNVIFYLFLNLKQLLDFQFYANLISLSTTTLKQPVKHVYLTFTTSLDGINLLPVHK